MWQSGRILSLQFLLLFPIKQLTYRFITRRSDKERNTGRHIRATGGAGSGCLAAWVEHFSDKQETEHEPQQNLSFEGEQGFQTKGLELFHLF